MRGRGGRGAGELGDLLLPQAGLSAADEGADEADQLPGHQDIHQHPVVHDETCGGKSWVQSNKEGENIDHNKYQQMQRVGVL